MLSLFSAFFILFQAIHRNIVALMGCHCSVIYINKCRYLRLLVAFSHVLWIRILTSDSLEAPLKYWKLKSTTAGLPTENITASHILNTYLIAIRMGLSNMTSSI